MQAFNSNAILETITCPITQCAMRDPVQGSDGHTYERSAIMSALAIKSESPITRQRMTVNDLKPNVALRFLCDNYNAWMGASPISPVTSPVPSPEKKLTLDHTMTSNSTISNKLLLTFDVNGESNGHLSQDIVLVIDRSGSMQSQVEAKDVNGQNLENGLSIQDIVNHSAKTIVQTLDPQSRICIIKFDNVIDVVTPLMCATDANKVQILSLIHI